MIYDLSFLWIWLVLAALVGAVVGWRHYEPGPQGQWFEGWPQRAAMAWGAALVVVVIHLLSGRLAFWLESAVLFFLAYVIGALVGGSDYAQNVERGGAGPALVAAPAGAAGGLEVAAPEAPVAEPAPVGDAQADQEEAHIKSVLATLPKDASAQQKADAVGRRPAGLDKPRAETADDLQRIKGIGPVNQRHLNALGIYHFDQIASWTREEIRWVGTYLSFPGRIDREHWVSQADNLARGGRGLKEAADA